ncbi:MAG: VanW family protein [Caldilineaceae bacterium]
MAAINEAYLIGRQGSFLEKTADQIGAFVGRYNVDPPLTFDEGAVRQQISQIAAELRRPGRAGVQMGSVTLPSQPGLDVDVDATAAQVMSALSAHEVASIPIQTFAVQPPDAATTVNGSPATTAMREPITLREAQSGLSFALDAAVLSTIDPNGDASRINERAAFVGGNMGRPGRYPRPGRTSTLQPRHRTGRSDQPQRHRALVGCRGDDQRREAGPDHEDHPDRPADQRRRPRCGRRSNVGALGIRELVASGTTYFRGSSLARIRNIEVAAEKFVGVVIAPGDVFSFNQIVQDVSAANGFEDSAIIWGDQTMVGVGGGVCQVSTTVFRAALNAGFPIVERYNHGYVVSWYGEPGMDATIYTPNVDFRFRNDTDAYLLVQPTVDSVNGVITFDFFGAKPDRQVTIGQPVITDVKEPGDPVYRIDESLAPGQRRQVEYAQRGMTVTVERTVTENGDTRVDKIVSEYQPWNAVFLVPPGTEIPATATPEVGD